MQLTVFFYLFLQKYLLDGLDVVFKNNCVFMAFSPEADLEACARAWTGMPRTTELFIGLANEHAL